MRPTGEEATGPAAAAGEEGSAGGTSETADAGRGADHHPDAVLQAGGSTGRTGSGTADRQAQKVRKGLRRLHARAEGDCS